MNTRLHGMDALRGIAMWLGVVLHSIIAYQTDPRPTWPKDAQSHVFFDLLYTYLHAFRMPLFFVVAGFFAHMLCLKIGESRFVSHRKKRILYPFLLCLVTIIPLSGLPFHYNRLSSDLVGSELLYATLSAATRWTGLYHIWFLYYLLMFYIIMMIARQIPFTRLSKFQIKSDSIFFLTGIGLFLIQYFLYSSSVEAYTGIFPYIPQIFYFGFFFLLGYLLYRYPDFLNRNKKARFFYLMLGVLLCFVLVFYPIESYLLFSITISASSLLLVLGHIMLFMTFFKKENKILRYISDSSYWFYLIHLPIVAALQLLWKEVDFPIFFKALSIIVFTTAFSIWTYHLFVRNTTIGVLLNGKKLK